MKLDPWHIEHLVCPRTHLSLKLVKDYFLSKEGMKYPIVDGIPIMLLEDEVQTMEIAHYSMARARGEGVDERCPDLYLESLGISEKEKELALELFKIRPNHIDPVVSAMVAATNGNMYKHLMGKLAAYPIPDFPLPQTNNEPLLDIGCNWGRWTVAAAKKGYFAVGIDPSLGAVMAARRVADQLGIPAKYIVADGRFLPFRPASFDVIHSYSVLQHLNKNDAKLCLEQIANVLKIGGKSVIQMPNKLGIRNLYNQAKRGFHEAKNFEVRYWSVRELKEIFGSMIGPTTISVDGYLGLGIQKGDFGLMPFYKRVIILLSSLLTALSKIVPIFSRVADSVYVTSRKVAA